MGGGLLQLVAYGAQDVYLTGNPQITFFKVVYRRHTNFAMESIEQTYNGNPTFGSRVSVLVTRNGDLINRVYFNAIIKNTSSLKSLSLVPFFGHRLLKNIELEIGGQRIDKHYSEWLYIWNELSMPKGKKAGYYTMVGGNTETKCIELKKNGTYEIYVPLEFWFCRNVGLALPLIALQYHEVKINIEFANAHEMVDTNGVNYTTGVDITNDNSGSATDIDIEQVKLWVDYIYLDTDERRKFAQLSHEYLIEQLQFTGSEKIIASNDGGALRPIRMNFNHPCKEIIWTIKPTGHTETYWNNFSQEPSNDDTVSSNPVRKAKLQLNGNDRFAEKDGLYFGVVQPYQHHENVPEEWRGINLYSFALKPEEHQPSGTLNMSRIDTTVLNINSSVTGTISVYSINYNVLRILSGMGGLAYSN